MKQRLFLLLAMTTLVAACHTPAPAGKGPFAAPPPPDMVSYPESASGSMAGGTAAGMSAGGQEATTEVKTAKDARYSGFLKPAIYERLRPSPYVEGVKAYVDTSRDYRPFTKIMFMPTEVYLTPNPEYKGLPKEALERMTAQFQDSFKRAMTPGYTIVNAPGPDVLLVKTAITGVQPTSPNLKAIDFLPIKAVFNVARDAAGHAPQVVEMSSELEVMAPDGSTAAAATATRKGDAKLPQGEQISWAQMKEISDYWARSFRQRLDELRQARSAQ